MAKRKTAKRDFIDLTWNDLQEWAGNNILARGKDYQKHGHVSELARTKDNGLIAWARGSEEYATKVVMDNDGLPDSDCTCPYQYNCKHGIAVVLEYLEQVKKNKTVPIADKNERFSEYLDRKHPVEAWNSITDSLINRLNNFKSDKELDSSRNYKRDQISNWAIFALEKAGRNNEIISLCEAEAEKTGSYVRLVKMLIEDKRHEDAEGRIHKGVKRIGDKWPGIAADLRGSWLTLRAYKRDWHSASMNVFEFVRYPSNGAFSECKKTAEKVNLWPKVRELLLTYLEKGVLP